MKLSEQYKKLFGESLTENPDSMESQTSSIDGHSGGTYKVHTENVNDEVIKWTLFENDDVVAIFESNGNGVSYVEKSTNTEQLLDIISDIIWENGSRANH